MAFTPVLERLADTKEDVSYDYTSQDKADQIHNALIKERYARLMNPALKRTDLSADLNEEVSQPVNSVAVEETSAAAQEIAPVQAPAPYLVQNARADADIFRADSFVNRVSDAQPEQTVISEIDEEENEDLKPTPTTIQYRTSALDMTMEEGTIENKSAGKRLSLSKRDKIIIAVVVSVIVALFALIIINSAIISNLNSDLGSLQSSLNNARNAYQKVNSEIADYNANLEETVRVLAESLGMVK